jgi:hypothetical protein
MLALCESKAAALGLSPRLYEQRMESLALPRRYRTILVPSSSFQLLTDPNDARSALARLHDHLEPGGTLVMSFMRMRRKGQPDVYGWIKREATRADGAIVRRWTRGRYDPETQLEHEDDRYELIVDGEVVRTEEDSRSPATRDYTVEQTLAMYRDAGLVEERALKAFTFEAAAEDEGMWCVLGVAPR